MSDKSSPKRDATLEEPLDEHQRPTVHPPFDVAAFARAETAAHADDTEPPRYSERITITNELELERGPSIDPRPTPREWPPVEPDSKQPSDGPNAPEITEQAIEDPLAEMRRCFSVQDYPGAMAIAELILAEDPRNLAASGCKENCRIRLENRYAAVVAPYTVPRLLVAHAHAQSRSIDHRAGFLLSLIDGSSTVQDILEQSGMPRLDVLRILYELDQRRVISLDLPG